MNKKYHAIKKIPSRVDIMCAHKGKRLPRMKTIRVLEFPPPLTQSEIKALKTLAEAGPTNPYQIAKKAAKSYSLMFKAVKELERRRMVKLEGKERTEKGTMANIYDLTLKGVLSVLEREFHSKTWNRGLIYKIIRKYDSLLPSVFGKWSYLKKMGVGKEVLYRLQTVAVNLKRGIFERGDSTLPGANMEQKICWFFYFWGYYPIPLYDSFPGFVPDPKVWKNVWKQDEDIRAYVIEKLKEEQKKVEHQRFFLAKILSFLEA